MYENERLFWIILTVIIIILALYCISKANIALEDSNQDIKEAADCIERQAETLKDYQEALTLKDIQLNEGIALAEGFKLKSIGEFTITFYSYDSGYTASGTRVVEGRTVATDPEVIPPGSLIGIPGFDYRLAEDTGADIKGNRLDIYIADEAEARELGVKKANIWIVEGDQID